MCMCLSIYVCEAYLHVDVYVPLFVCVVPVFA